MPALVIQYSTWVPVSPHFTETWLVSSHCHCVWKSWRLKAISGIVHYNQLSKFWRDEGLCQTVIFLLLLVFWLLPYFLLRRSLQQGFWSWKTSRSWLGAVSPCSPLINSFPAPKGLGASHVIFCSLGPFESDDNHLTKYSPQKHTFQHWDSGL